jgi:zinc transporter
MRIHSLQPSGRSSGEQAPARTDWIDLDRSNQEDRDWLKADPNLADSTVEMLLDAAPRTRCAHSERGTFIALVSPDDEDDDEYQDLCAWLDTDRIITVRRGAASVVDPVAARVDEGSERGDHLALFAALIVGIAMPVERSIAELAEDADDLEGQALDAEDIQVQDQVAVARRRALAVRRRLNTIRDLVASLVFHPERFPSNPDLDSLRRAADYLGHLLSQLDASRDRLTLLSDQLSAMDQHRINRAMQKLAVVGTVFLPLTFLTGLLGINVAGIPDAHDPMAFWVVCAVLVVIVAIALVIIKRKDWI